MCRVFRDEPMRRIDWLDAHFPSARRWEADNDGDPAGSVIAPLCWRRTFLGLTLMEPHVLGDLQIVV
eukprot:COSAG02_NODE_1296_length_13393_cov_15.825109_10_plen_67_part_00